MRSDSLGSGVVLGVDTGPHAQTDANRGERRAREEYSGAEWFWRGKLGAGAGAGAGAGTIAGAGMGAGAGDGTGMAGRLELEGLGSALLCLDRDPRVALVRPAHEKLMRAGIDEEA